MAEAFQEVGLRAVIKGYETFLSGLGKMGAAVRTFGATTTKAGNSLAMVSDSIRGRFSQSIGNLAGANRVATTSTGGLKSALGGLGKTVAGVAGGFIVAQAGIAGVQKVLHSSIGAAMAYEHQMAQIRALTGATKKDTDVLTESIRDMQKSLPKSSQELGAGAYFILSSGITDATDAAEVLEIAAKASTVGLGETAVVADALTTVLNAYGKEAGEAGQVTDVLIQAVKDGKAEADAFSGVLGRVVPLAAQMGISFEEVAANLATFTRLGVSAEEAATGLRGVFNAMLKPSEDARKTLAGIGLTFQELREQIREKGLAATLQTLIDRFGGNEEALSKLFPEVRGLTNVLATAGVQADAYSEILGNMDEATGNLDKGFAEISDTTQFKMQKAMNDLNVVLEELGAETLPVLAYAASRASDAIVILAAAAALARGDTSKLNLSLVDSAEGLLDMASALPTPFVGLGHLKNAAVDFANLDVGGGFRQIGESAGLMGDGVIAAGGAVGIFGSGGQANVDMQEFQGEIDGMVHRADEMKTAFEENEEAGGDFGLAMKGVKDDLAALEIKAGEVRDALFKMFKEPTQEEVEAEAALARYEAQEAALLDVLAPTSDAIKDQAKQLAGQGGNAEDAELKLRGMTDAHLEEYHLLHDNLIPETQDHIRALSTSRAAQGATAEATYGTALSQEELQRQAGLSSTKLDELARYTGIEEHRLQDLVRGTGAAASKFGALAAAQQGTLGTIDAFLEHTKDARRGIINETTSVDTLIHRLASIPSEIRTDVKITPILTKTSLSIEMRQLLSGAQYGFHGMVTGPRAFYVEPGMTERVDITPKADLISPPALPAAPATIAASGPGSAELAAAVATALSGMYVKMDGDVVGRLVGSRLGGDTWMRVRGG